ncbi:MAG TPA: hypothetical protein GXZ46_06130 [Actinomycetales bacterium]|uniref:hypothetical protein n=1 Tax=uncultured Corynebacterium sp. TaxID=159447 RepID=UPI00176A46E0|nr:hypothetical protein [uncultured Corynebacterium sp.]HHU45192.1 hypothetical protein [Actinomycetales bacterium]
MTGAHEPRHDLKARRMRVEALAGFMFFWTLVVGGWAAYRIAVGEPSVALSFVLLLLVIIDVIIWRRWRELA